MEQQPEICPTCQHWNQMTNRNAGYCRLTGRVTLSLETCEEWVGKDKEKEQ